MADSIEIVSLHAVGAVRNGGSRSESEDGTVTQRDSARPGFQRRIEDGGSVSSLFAILYPSSSHLAQPKGVTRMTAARKKGGMKIRLALSVLFAAALVTPAFAKTFKVPDENSVASITIADSWKAQR
ncbi:MAG: hypothetical protein LC627_01940 [Verrucomicrobiaceae bacterium]|nr:hypothetical protein [Verrucomicrobiaceae bacterium]